MRYKVQGAKCKKMRVHWCTGALVHWSVFSCLLLVLVFQISCSDHRVPESPRPRVTNAQAQPTRIVSLAPSITEVLFKLDLGDRVVGVSRYCDYPPEAEDKPKVGGYLSLIHI